MQPPYTSTLDDSPLYDYLPLARRLHADYTPTTRQHVQLLATTVLNQHRLELKNAQEARERERELAKEIQDGDIDEDDAGGDFEGL